jgi:hypothetical protein
MTPPTGRVVGRVPTCEAVSSGPGRIVRVNFETGNKVVSPNFVFASPKVSDPFAFDLAPGTYRVASTGGSARRVTVRTGRISHLGVFGVCSSATTPTTSHFGGPGPTTSTTTLSIRAVQRS